MTRDESRQVEKTPFTAAIIYMVIAVSLIAGSLVRDKRDADRERMMEFLGRPEIARIVMTERDAPARANYRTLGEVEYSEKLARHSQEWMRIEEKLKTIAFARWPGAVDAIVAVRSQTYGDGEVKISGKAIKYGLLYMDPIDQSPATNASSNFASNEPTR